MTINRQIQITCLNAIRLMILAYLIIFGNISYSAVSKTYTLGAIVFPPLSIKKPNSNECIGSAIDISRQVIESTGNTLKVLCAPPARIYKMIEQGTVDFTINVKSTQLLQPYVTFIEPRFTTLQLNLYTYDKDMPLIISGIRGFDYLGQRQKIEMSGYKFNDLSSATEAIEVFIRGRTKALITYQGPMNSYLTNNSLPNGISREELQSIGTYYAISKASPSYDELTKLLTNYILGQDKNEFLSLH